MGWCVAFPTREIAMPHVPVFLGGMGRDGSCARLAGFVARDMALHTIAVCCIAKTPRGHRDVGQHNFTELRKAMVASQLRTTAVNDPRVVEAMSIVQREHFVTPDRAGLAYLDISQPIGAGRELPAPMVLGRLLTEARIRPQDRVLVIGAGSGYAAAVLALLAGHVVALEEDATLPGIGGAAVPSTVAQVSGPLIGGWAASAPYDVILFDGAIERVPQAIVDQLADGGRIAAGLVENGVTRLAIGRRAGGSFGMTTFVEAAVPILPGFASPEGFRF
jgi:protein-L-isoaspartate(D-aspartate) O-methyltransferase